MEEEDNVAELKRKLEQAVGIPAADMKIRLGGYNQFVMIDTTSNIRVGSCGLTQGAQGTGAGRRNTNRHGAVLAHSPPSAFAPSRPPGAARRR